MSDFKIEMTFYEMFYLILNTIIHF